MRHRAIHSHLDLDLFGEGPGPRDTIAAYELPSFETDDEPTTEWYRLDVGEPTIICPVPPMPGRSK